MKLKNIKIILSLILVFAVFGVPRCFAVDDPTDFQTYGEMKDEQSFLQSLEKFQNNVTSPYEEVLTTDWTYDAIRQLEEAGLLDGVTGPRSREEGPLTRVEIANIVSKLVDNYLEWKKTGKVKAIVPMPAVRNTNPGRLPMLVEQPPLPDTRIVNIPIPAMPAPETIRRTTTGGGSLSRRGPTSLSADESAVKPGGGPERIAQPTTPTVKQPAVAPEDDKIMEKLVEVQKKIDLSVKDVAALQKLVDKFAKELKDLNKSLKKEITEGKKITMQNQRQIKALDNEDKRFRITGTNEFKWGMIQNIADERYWEDSGDTHAARGTVALNDTLTLNFNSTPVPNDKVSINATVEAPLDLAGDFTDESPLSLKTVSMVFDNSQEDPKSPRHFKTRNFTVGNTSVMFSPLTVFGKKITGITTQMGLGKYTVNLFGARTAKHPFWILGDVIPPPPYFSDNAIPYVQYDQYLYGANLNFGLFGNPQSMANLSKIYMTDNKHTNYPYCNRHSKSGKWVDNTGYWNFGEYVDYTDPYLAKGVNSDRAYQDVFCLPPEKNSVESFFLRHPIMANKNGNIFITAEVGHSTFFTRGYKAVYDVGAVNPDDTDEIDRRKKNAIPYSICDTKDPGKEFKCYLDVPQMEHQDDAFLLLFDYNKGPVKIFPVGYARLGPNFVTKNFGFPGLDMSQMTSMTSVLPINIQSLGLYMGSFSYDATQKYNLKYSNMYVAGEELKPMYFSPGGLAKGMSANSGQETSMKVLMPFISRLNNRTSKLNLVLWNNDLTYNMSQKITMTAGTTRVHAWMSPFCLDGDIVEVKDNKGNIVDVVVGDGQKTCGTGSGSDSMIKLDVVYAKQKFGVNWNTSKSTTVKFSFESSEIKMNFDLGTQAVNDAVSSLVPKGKVYKIDNVVDLKLTPSTTVTMQYISFYDRMPEGDDTYKYPTYDSRSLLLGVKTNF